MPGPAVIQTYVSARNPMSADAIEEFLKSIVVQTAERNAPLFLYQVQKHVVSVQDSERNPNRIVHAGYIASTVLEHIIEEINGSCASWNRSADDSLELTQRVYDSTFDLRVFETGKEQNKQTYALAYKLRDSPSGLITITFFEKTTIPQLNGTIENYVEQVPQIYANGWPESASVHKK